ncbi:MAG: LemA family protein [Candidatus Paceibacterota bacterium]
MTSAKRNWLIAIVIIVVVAGSLYSFFKGTYNQFVTLDEAVKSSWAQVENQLQRRYDLIPNLVETVKGYAAHEASAFENVTKARAAAMGAGSGTHAEQAQAENQLSGALKTLFAVSEAYPDLKANQNFLQLQKELGDTEDKIQASRRFYNTTVMSLNTALQSFPGNLIASTFNFAQMDLFELGADEQAAKQPVKVRF